MKSIIYYYRLFESNLGSYASGSVPFDHDYGSFQEELRDVVLAPDWCWSIKEVRRKEYEYK